MTQPADYGALVDEVDRARAALNSTHWWQLIRRQEAAGRYKRALLRGALWEINHGVTHPTKGEDPPSTPIRVK